MHPSRLFPVQRPATMIRTTACLRLGRSIIRRRLVKSTSVAFRKNLYLEISTPPFMFCRSLIVDTRSSGPVVEAQVVEKTSVTVSTNEVKDKDERSAAIERDLQQALKNHQELMETNADNELLIESLETIRDYYHELQWWDDALATESTLLDYVGDNDSKTADCFGRMGRYYLELQKFRQAQRCFQTCLELLQELHPSVFHREIGRTYNDLARVILEQGDTALQQSLPHLEQAENHYRYHGLKEQDINTDTLELLGEKENATDLCKVLKNQALLYRINDRHDVARNKYQEALDFVQEEEQEQERLEIQVSIADCLLSIEHHEEALDKYKELVEGMRGVKGTALEGVIRHNIGLIHSKKGRRDDALHEFQQAYDIKRRMLGESHFEVATTLNGLGAVEASRGNRGEALSFFNEALLISRVNADEELGDNDPNVQHALRNIAMLRGDGRTTNITTANDPLSR